MTRNEALLQRLKMAAFCLITTDRILLKLDLEIREILGISVFKQ